MPVRSISIQRVSDYYELPYKQGELPFVDVDIHGDTRLYIDPRAIHLLPTAWGDECVTLLQDFFQSVLVAIREGRDADAKRLLQGLREPNETHLGLSRGTQARGRGLGNGLADDVWSTLTRSQAARTGLLVDLEDAALMVEGIDRDIISDITTNIIRGPLIRFTQEMCQEYGIPTEPGIDSGAQWDYARKEWVTTHVNLPRTDGGKLLLVPKVIVRRHLDYERDEYTRDYILTHLQGVEITARSALVQLLKNGKVRVTKKSLREKYGDKKTDIVSITEQYPEILERYRSDKKRRPGPPLELEEFEETAGIALPRWDQLLQAVLDINPGKAGADKYHAAVERLLTPLFQPSLSFPQKEFNIHSGRKRIDIKYANSATSGFFHWVATSHPAMHVFVECKNYTGDPTNPELDQLSGRFSPSRGKFGLLLCRSFKNKNLFIQRCKDTANDARGFIIALDDQDLTKLVELRKNGDTNGLFEFLQVRFTELIT